MAQSLLRYRKSHALLIGIDAYLRFPPLFTAVKGVRELSLVLQEELGFQPENIITLENEQATQRAIQRSLLDPLSREEKVGPQDRVLVYFAGHGTTVDTAAGAVGYLIPVDAEPEYEDTFVAMDDLTRTAAERIYAKHVLFLLDACFSGFATTRMAEGVKRELGDLLRSPSRQVITAGMRDQVVSDIWGPGGHSLFTGFLIEGLRGSAPMPGGILRTFHLAGYLQDQVAQHSRSRQTPQYASLMGSKGGDFVFAAREVSELPEWVLSAAQSSDTSQRLIAANKLREMASDTAHSEMAGQALAKLEEMSEDRDTLVQASVGAALQELMPQAEPTWQEREEPLVVQSVSVALSEEPIAVRPLVPEPTAPVVKPAAAEHKSEFQPTQAHPMAARPRSWTPVAIVGGVIAVAIVIGGLALGGVLNSSKQATAQPTQAGAASQPTQSGPETATLPGETPTLAVSPASEPTVESATALAVVGVTSNSQWKPAIQEVNGVKMALVPKGCFQMGSDGGNSDERPVHQVCFDEPFLVDVYEVTQAQFAKFGGQAANASKFTGDNLPREKVSWFEADEYCRKRGARLPTEAEWEYVARGPDGLTYPWGNDFVVENVVYSGNSGSETWEVGSKPGGVSWVGAYDLSGNVWEWVADWYETYPAGQQLNPIGPDTGLFRVQRGGSWLVNGINVRATLRLNERPSNWSSTLGFRCGGSAPVLP